MKAILLIACITISITSWGQNRGKQTTSLLSWLIKKDHITHLNIKSNAGVFYDTTNLKKQTIVDESFKEINNLCLRDLISTKEVEAFKAEPRMLMQTDWRIKYSKLKVKFVTDKFAMQREVKNTKFTVYAFSEPLFLNKSYTRVLIGESFTCGMACGRMDLLLCEFKSGSWRLIARAIIENE